MSPGDLAALERALHEAAAQARAAWPAVELDAAAFAAELTERVSRSADPLRALEKLHAADLFIACAAARDTPGALAALERRYFPEVARAAAVLDRSPAFADEVQQILRERLFLARADAAPGIAQYAGTGPLGAWLRISALRAGARLREGQGQKADATDLGELVERTAQAAGGGPEVEYLKATYRAQFRQAFHDSLSALSARERTVLRLHAVDGLTGEQIAAAYGVNPSTSSRWLARARETLQQRTHALLSERLELEASQLDSLAGLVLSQLDLSLPRVLRD